MPDPDVVAARREIAEALLSALERRHEVLDAIVDAEDTAAAIDSVTALLGISRNCAEAVVGLRFDQITEAARRRIAKEIDDLNSQLSFTSGERPASRGDDVSLRPFDSAADRDIFARRTEDIGAAGDGSGGPAGSVDDEISAARERVRAEEAVWFVVDHGADKVGMVFGELVEGEVDVRIWIHPDHRKMGYGTASLRKSRSEMAAYFPAVPMVVRAPGATPG